MELGKAKLLKTGLNALHQAIHPVHGIAWTDGKQVCLTSIFYVSGEVKFGDSNVIGQFEHVFGLFWSPLCCKGSPALLAVQHKKHITVWQLQLSAQEPNKLLCTQTCEMSEPFPLLSQGCVWHPKQDILAVLTKRDASVLFSVRVDNRRVKADICASGAVHCACWTKDGARLVVAMGGDLHSFMWNDVDKSLLPCAFCPVFDVGGNVCAVQPTGESQVAVATELPLDKLCGLNAGMAFEMPVRDAPTRHGHPQDACGGGDGGGAGPESSRRRFLETACSSLASSGPVDLTQLLARHRRSDPSPLLNLTRRDAAVTGSGQDSSHLILVTYERKVTTSRKVNVPGILVPDIVAFDPRGTTVAVASNACSMVLVYCITASAVPNVQQISLQKNERPKGAWFLSDKLLLLMVGRLKSAGDAVFLPSSSSSSSSSNTEKYVLRLVARDLVPSNDTAADLAPACVSSPALRRRTPDSPAPQLPYERIRRHSDLMPSIERLGQGIKDLVLPGGAVVQCPGSSGSSSSSSISSRHKLVEEVAAAAGQSGEASPVTSRANVSAASSSSSITADNSDMESHIVGRMHANAALAAAAAAAVAPATSATPAPAGPALTFNRDSSRASSPAPRHDGPDKPLPPPPRSATPTTPAADRCGSAAGRERGLEQLVENMERLFARFSDVQQCVVEIRDYAQNGKKAIAAAAATAYPAAYEPPYVNVTCQKQLSENVFTDERRPVLLCEGKLRLSALHDLFNLTTVEMVYGPLWVVLVADASGFIPLTFKSRDEVTVRNALRRTPLLTPGSPDTPGPPALVMAPPPTLPAPPPPIPGPSSPTPTPTPTTTPSPTLTPSPSQSHSSIPVTPEAST